MARVLVTTLGTGQLLPSGSDDNLSNARLSRKYRKAVYVIDNQQYEKEYIAEALIQHFQFDRIFMVGTAKSMWEQVYYSFTQEECNEEYYLELAEKIDGSTYNQYQLTQADLHQLELALDKKLKSTGSRCLLIKYGLNDEELLYNFHQLMIIADLLQPGDQVYVDITHSFRSIAMFEYLMLSFIENLPDKRIEIKKIFYGMLDISRETGGRAPVVDLTIINHLNHWIKGIYELENYGSGYLVASLLRGDNRYRELGDSIEDLSNRININYLKDIRKERGRALWQHLGHIAGPGSFATKTLDRFLKMFGGTEQESFFQLKVARWCFEKKRYATGYITLAEAIITRLCEIKGLNNPPYIVRQQVKNDYRGKQHGYLHGLGELLEKVNSIRNMIAHFDGGSEDNYQSAVKNCMKYCEMAERMFRQVGEEFLLNSHNNLAR